MFAIYRKTIDSLEIWAIAKERKSGQYNISKGGTGGAIWKDGIPTMKGRISPTKGMHWYKSLDEKQYGMFKDCPRGWVKTNPQEVNKRLRLGK